MTYTTPFTAVPLAIIQASGHNTSIRDNIIHLNNRTGGDPGGAGKLLISSGTATGAWGANDISTQPVLANNIALRGKTTGGATQDLVRGNSSNNVDIGDASWNDVNLIGGGDVKFAKTGAGTYKIWNETNDGPGSTLDADTVDGIHGSALAPIASPTFTGVATSPRYVVNAGGSAGSPAFEVSGGEGIFSRPSNGLGFATNGICQAELDADGRLLIGTSVPAETVSGQWIRVGSRVLASNYDVTSARDLKRDIRDLELDPLALMRGIRPRQYVRRGSQTEHIIERRIPRLIRREDGTDEIIEDVERSTRQIEIPDREEVGFIADELNAAGIPGATDGSYELGGLLSVVAAAVRTLAERVDSLEAAR